MTSFSTAFSNETDSTWVFTLFQTLPNSVGLDSVAWKTQTVAGPGGQSGVSWRDTFDAVIGEFDPTLQLYNPTQLLPTQPGSAWKIVFKDNIQQLEPDGNALRSDTILIRNQSCRNADAGLGMDKSGALYQRNLISGANVSFETHPTYWVALFDEIKLGEVIVSGSNNVATISNRFNIFVGPKQIDFPTGITDATITAAINGQSIELTVTFGSPGPTSTIVRHTAA